MEHLTNSYEQDATAISRRKKNAIFAWCIICNILIYADRGVLTGITQELSIMITHDLQTATPDLFIGLLQSAFIGAYIIGCPIAAYALRFTPGLLAMAIGMTIWGFSVLLTGMMGVAGTYWGVFFFRLLTGIGEASFAVVFPSLLFNYGGKYRGKWFGAFLSAIPVGMALGFIFSSLIAQTHLGWSFAYIFLAIAAVPLIAFLYVISRKTVMHVYNNPTLLDEIPSSTISTSTQSFSSQFFSRCRKNLSEYAIIFVNPYFLLFVIAQACQASFLQILSTFGPKIMINLQFFKKEISASITMGVCVCITGLTGGIVGGVLADIQKGEHNTQLTSYSNNYSTDNDQSICYKSQKRDFGTILYLARIGTCLSLFSAICYVLYVAIRSQAVSIVLLAMSFFFLFTIQVFYSIGQLASVEATSRPTLTALAVFIMHCFGDVPAPIAAGAILDRLAPGCKIVHHNGPTPACIKDMAGLVKFEWIISAYLFIIFAAFIIIWQVSRRHAKAQITLQNF